MQIISNDKLKSIYHRVTANSVGPRISIAAFFLGPFLSPKKYGPLKELVSEENPPMYKEFTVQEFLKHFFNRSIDQPAIQRFQQAM